MAAVVILNREEEVLERMADALVCEGYETTARLLAPTTSVGELANFIATHEPLAVVYDLRPYDRECLQLLHSLLSHPDLPEVPFVLTSDRWPRLPFLQPGKAVVAMAADSSSLHGVIAAVRQACSRTPSGAVRPSGVTSP
jgi:hypothetical protein